jgi:hypothetical protein
MNFILRFLLVLQLIGLVCSSNGLLDSLLATKSSNNALDALFKTSSPAKGSGVLSHVPEMEVPDALNNFGTLFNAGNKPFDPSCHN